MEDYIEAVTGSTKRVWFSLCCTIFHLHGTWNLYCTSCRCAEKDIYTEAMFVTSFFTVVNFDEINGSSSCEMNVIVLLSVDPPMHSLSSSLFFSWGHHMHIFGSWGLHQLAFCPFGACRLQIRGASDLLVFWRAVATGWWSTRRLPPAGRTRATATRPLTTNRSKRPRERRSGTGSYITVHSSRAMQTNETWYYTTSYLTDPSPTVVSSW